MDLIDRHIAEVGKHLPNKKKKKRSDIQKETRSTLDDMLDDRFHRRQIRESLSR